MKVRGTAYEVSPDSPVRVRLESQGPRMAGLLGDRPLIGGRRADGTMITASPQYVIDVLEDMAPTVAISKPGRDTNAPPVEEFPKSITVSPGPKTNLFPHLMTKAEVLAALAQVKRR